MTSIWNSRKDKTTVRESSQWLPRAGNQKASTTMRLKRTFWGHGIALCFACGGGYISVYNHQNLTTVYLKWVNCMQIFLTKTIMKNWTLHGMGTAFIRTGEVGPKDSHGESWAEVREDCPAWRSSQVPAEEGPWRSNGEERESPILYSSLTLVYVTYWIQGHKWSEPEEAHSSI